MKFGHPRGHVFYRRPSHKRPMISKGEGPYLYDCEGRRYLDASGGPLVTNLGYGITEVVEAIAKQVKQVGYIHASMFTSQPLEEYAQALSEVVNIPEARFFFLSSGSEAVETTIKLSRQVHVERGQASKSTLISRWGSYHGTTLGALTVSGKPKMRDIYKPLLLDTPHIPPPYCYRCPYELSHPNCQLRCAEALREAIRKIGEENAAAFIAEPVGGATLGAIVPPEGYWQRIREICDQFDLFLIADEVMTGFGRTGKWFATEHWEVTPDMMTMAKGTAGGYFPLSITAVHGELVEDIVQGSGDFVHGGTYSHHPVAAAAGLATLRFLQEKNLISSVASTGARLGEKLRSSFANGSCVGDIRGIGLLWALEFVADRDQKTPFPPSYHFAQTIADEAFRRGLIIYPSTGCVDGLAGDLIMLGPPYSITESQVDEILEVLHEAIQAAQETWTH